MKEALEISQHDAEWILDQVKAHLVNKSNLLIRTDNGDEVVILGRQELYWCSQSSRLLQPMGPASIERLPASDQRVEQTLGSGRPLSELLWSLGFFASSGKLLEGCRRDDVVKLTRWPNLTRLPKTASCFRIAALLRSRPSSLVLASRILHLPEQELFQFYSAAQSAGYIEAVNRGADATAINQPQGQNAGRLSLIRKLFDHLKVKSATA